MKTLAQNVINIYGKKGKDWLDALPEFIKALSTYWNLTEMTPVDNMSYHYVAKAISNGDQKVILMPYCWSRQCQAQRSNRFIPINSNLLWIVMLIR